MVRDIHQALVSSPIFHAATASTSYGVFFSADDVTHGRELWISDGTEAGTHIVKDIHPGLTFSFLGIHAPFFISQSNLLYFGQGFAETGTELWRSDGTETGTFMLKDVWPGPDGQPPFGPSVWEVNSFVFSNSNDGVHGSELWRTNGTQQGTQFVQDFEPGAASSIITGMIEINGIVYAAIQTSATGSELWTSTFAALPISLFDFEGMLIGYHAKLNWKTQNAVSNSTFVLERSFDKNQFTSVATVRSKNQPGVNLYQYVDSNITYQSKSVVFYRVKQVEPDGNFNYSSLVTMRIPNAKVKIRVLPNPVKTDLRIQLNSQKSQRVTVKVTDMNGIVRLQEEVLIAKGIQTLVLDAKTLYRGAYVFSLRVDDVITKELFFKE